MNKEKLLKEIMKLPKIETNNPIITMNSITIDDIMSVIDRLNKVPDYNDLLKENKQLKEKLYLCTPEIPQNSHNNYISYVDLINKLYSIKKENQKLKKQLEECYCNRTDCSSRIKDSKKYDSLVQAQEAQQKKFIKYLEDEIQKKSEKSKTFAAFIRNVVPLQQCLQKYKETIGDDK